MATKSYHGWVVLVDQGPGMNHKVFAEYLNAGGKRDRKEFGYGEFGCTRAVEFFDKRVGQPIQLEPVLKGCYRVFTKTDG